MKENDYIDKAKFDNDPVVVVVDDEDNVGDYDDEFKTL